MFRKRDENKSVYYMHSGSTYSYRIEKKSHAGEGLSLVC